MPFILSISNLFFTVGAFVLPEPAELVLLQTHAHKVPADVGRTAHPALHAKKHRVRKFAAPITELGYEQVLSQDDDEAVKTFVRKLLGKEGRWIREESGLASFVQRNLRTHRPHTLDDLKAQVRSAEWVNHGMGREAALNEKGYTRVLLQHSEYQTKAYARRILASEGYSVGDEMQFSEFVKPFYSASASQYDFAALKKELLSKLHLTRISESTHANWTGSNAPLSEEGFRAISTLNDVEQMSSFMKRLMDSEGCWVNNVSQLSQHASAHLGNRSNSGSFADLRKEVRNASWVNHGLGRSAPLSEEGYQSVALLRSDVQTKAFARRILASYFNASLNNQALDELVPYYSGTLSAQDFKSFKRTLHTTLKAYGWPSSATLLKSSKRKLRDALGLLTLRNSKNTQRAVVQHGVRTLEQNQTFDLSAGLLTTVEHEVEVPNQTASIEPQKALPLNNASLLSVSRKWVTTQQLRQKGILESQGASLENSVSQSKGMANTTSNSTIAKAANQTATLEPQVMTLINAGGIKEATAGNGSNLTETGAPNQTAALGVQTLPVGSVAALADNAAIAESKLAETGESNHTATLEARTMPNGNAAVPAEAAANTNSNLATTRATLESQKLLSGSNAELTEEGYQQVAALRSDNEMKEFVLRVLESEEKSVENEDGLGGLVPWYDGNKAVQNLQALKAELAAAWWVNQGVGMTAPLSEEGYQKVANLHKVVLMKDFARRILASLNGADALDDAKLLKILDYFDGEILVQDFETLKQELQSNIETHGPSGSTALLSEDGYKEVAALRNNTEMRSFIKRLLHMDGRSVRDEGRLSGFVPFYSGTASEQNFNKLRQELSEAQWVDHGLGRSAPLSSEGYQSVAALQSDVHMKAFVQRLLAQNGKPPMDEAKLNGLVPFYDGRVSVQDFDSLQDELFGLSEEQAENVDALNLLQVSASLVDAKRRRDEFPLSKAGYTALAAQRNDEEMKNFIQRLLIAESRILLDESSLDGLVPYYSGSKAVQTFERLRQELANAPWIDHGVGRTSPLTDEGYQSVLPFVGVNDTVQHKAFVRRVLKVAGFSTVPKDTLMEVMNASCFNLKCLMATRPLYNQTGDAFAANEEGYHLLLSLGDDERMKQYIKKMIQAGDRRIVDASGLDSLMQMKPESLQDLEKTLATASWLDHGIGRTAPLSKAGFRKVNVSNSIQLNAFAQRFFKHRGESSGIPNSYLEFDPFARAHMN